jgi:pSer/pThr/pTyr-binding forkhead associated (FHA) protein/uncharacterized RDD family membrane protein YckC
MVGDTWRYILSVDGRDIELTDGEVTLGRSRTATVRIEHESVSRSHALLTFERGQAVVKDLNSSNGTYVGGRRVLNETHLADGDRIQLGAAIIGFRLVSPIGPSDRTALIDDEVLGAVPLEAPAPELPVEPPPAPEPPAPSAPVAENPLEISAEELIHSPAGHRPEPVMGDAASALEAVKAVPEAPVAPALSPAAEAPAIVRSEPARPPPPPAREPSLPAEPPAAPVDERTPPPMNAVAAPAPVAPPPPPAPPPAPPARSRPPDATLSQVPLKSFYETPSPARNPDRDLSESRGERGDSAGIPENVAGFLPRLAALLVDVVVLLAINILLLSPIFLILFFRGELQSRETGPDMALVAVGILCSLLILTANLWYVVGGWAKTGRTPGKSLLGLAVISAGSSGAGIGWSAAFKRCVGTLLSALPLGLGYWVVLFRRDRRAWHDLIAGTWVVRIR